MFIVYQKYEKKGNWKTCWSKIIVENDSKYLLKKLNKELKKGNLKKVSKTWWRQYGVWYRKID